MKQTIAELGIGGTGWIIYSDCILPKRVIHIDVVNNWTDDAEYKMPRFLLRELLESNRVDTTWDLIVFASQIVYSTKEEAEEELIKEVSNTITSIEQKSMDQEKLREDSMDATILYYKLLKTNAKVTIPGLPGLSLRLDNSPDNMYLAVTRKNGFTFCDGAEYWGYIYQGGYQVMKEEVFVSDSEFQDDKEYTLDDLKGFALTGRFSKIF